MTALEATVFEALADPVRRALLDALRAGDRSVSELIEVVAARVRRITQPAVSQHLAALKQAGLVRSRKDGRRRIYTLRAGPLRRVHDWVAHYEAFWDDRLDALGQHLDTNPHETHGSRDPRAGREP
ncbi:MAG: ArsR/SmtB family transcription factor [Phycisphaerales bacterium JB037]